MQLRECIDHVLRNYLKASGENFTRHPMANFIRHEFPETVQSIVGENVRLLCRGTSGQSRWARGPGIEIFDRLVTTSAQKGYYPVYLFREDMRGVYLSLNQRMTEAKKLYKSDAKTALRALAGNYRALLGSATHGFSADAIDLAPSSPSNDTAFYEAGNIVAKYYPVGNLPTEESLVRDLRSIVELYRSLITGQTTVGSSSEPEGDEPPGMNFEDATKFRMHKRIERNAALAKKAKRIHGFICQVCGLNFETKYGAIGKGYIEAHHLRPLASLQGSRIAMDPRNDFAVLCSNCHRMVHCSGLVNDITRFKKENYQE